MAARSSPIPAPTTRKIQTPAISIAWRPTALRSVVIAFPKPVFPNGVTVEPDGSIVRGESYTGRVGRIRPNGKIEDLGRLSGDNPIPDGLKVGTDTRLYVTDFMGEGIHVLAPDGEPEGLIPCGAAPTNCAFAGDILWVTDPSLTFARRRSHEQGMHLAPAPTPGRGADL